ncbi:MAG: aromatic ring-hydroxylating dioxygenase subunit alpha [Alphaproteobacteria bacterium]
MQKYRDNACAKDALFQQDRIHRDVYLSEELFALEQERLFAKVWIFVGHASQVPRVGDFVTQEIAGQQMVLVRQTDQSLAVLMNRCAHKGAMLVTNPAGNTGRAFRCPYHGWSFRLDGSLLGMPMQAGYADTRMRECETGKGVQKVASAVHRGFVFVRVSESGLSFQEFFGSTLSFIDAMVDRSPEGELEVAGERLRNVIRCNWKVYLENINDTLHVHAAHESSANAAQAVWADKPADEPKPMAIEQLLPFRSGNDFMDAMGGIVSKNGHSVVGTKASIHSAYGDLPDYTAAMERSYGTARAREILNYTPQNMILYPSIAIKSSPAMMRVIRPLGPELTLLEAWAFRPKGAPELLLERALMYNRLTFSPMSVVAQDDTHVFETLHKGLRASGNEWVSLHRGYRSDENASDDVVTTGTNELLMRNQYRAWSKFMFDGETGEAAR